jgi:capsular polysaccharide biosynthesis protein
VIVLVVVLLTGAAVALSLAQPQRYEASVTILVGQDSGISRSPGDATGLQQLTKTMAQAVNSRPVTEAVVRRLDSEGLTAATVSQNLTAEQVPDTQFIRVSYTDTDPERARRVADAVGAVFSDRVAEISQDANAITATVWERAVTPTEPVSPNPLRSGILAFLASLVLGLVLAFALDYADGRWRSPEEAERLLGVPTFGVIPEFEVKTPRKAEKSRALEQ